jgi:hypothetical protein
MLKSAKKRPVVSSTTPVPAAKPTQSTTGDVKSAKVDPRSKQSRVIAMLQSSSGTTIAAMMRVTGWQQHSVRGFLAGVVRKRLKLKLGSRKVDGNRVYQITRGVGSKSGLRQSKRRPA